MLFVTAPVLNAIKKVLWITGRPVLHAGALAVRIKRPAHRQAGLIVKLSSGLFDELCVEMLLLTQISEVLFFL